MNLWQSLVTISPETSDVRLRKKCVDVRCRSATHCTQHHARTTSYRCLNNFVTRSAVCLVDRNYIYKLRDADKTFYVTNGTDDDTAGYNAIYSTG